MKIFELSHIGEFHTNHNEDSKVISDLGENHKLIAVMDGCSSGTDSQFASNLIGKILRKLSKHESYRQYAEQTRKEAKTLIEEITLKLFEELQSLNRQLDLNGDEILSTAIIGVIDVKNMLAELVVIGDGVIHHDGQTIEYENDNKPDYIGYHLKMDKHIWFQNRTEKLSLAKFRDLSISTDGIHTFKNFDDKPYKTIEPEAIIDEFFNSRQFEENSNKLKKIMIKMKDKYGLKPSDDLTIIRVIEE